MRYNLSFKKFRDRASFVVVAAGLILDSTEIVVAAYEHTGRDANVVVTRR